MTHRLAVDWGSSRLRVTRVPEGGPDETRRAATGASGLIGGGACGFEQALLALAGDWLGDCELVTVSGMATARGGWCETPYLPCPADLSGLGSHAVTGRIGDVPVRFLPGLVDPAGPDVMRGEEAQLARLAGAGPQVVVLPGTHSKWARLEGKTVLGFRTFMTGEIYDLVLHRSLAGRLAEGDAFDEDAFRRGLARGRSGVLGALFSARPAVLTGQFPPAEVAAYLSGICIGAEVAEAIGLFGDIGRTPVALCGAAPLLALYEAAFEEAGLPIARTSATE